MLEFDINDAVASIGREIKSHDKSLTFQASYRSMRVSNASLIHYSFGESLESIKNALSEHFPNELIYRWHFANYYDACEGLCNILSYFTQETPYLPTVVEAYTPCWIAVIVVPIVLNN